MSTWAEGLIVPVRKPIEELWPSPMARTLMTKRISPGVTPRLIGMDHHAGVAECGSLDGVFTRKGGTKEKSAGCGTVGTRG